MRFTETKANPLSPLVRSFLWFFFRGTTGLCPPIAVFATNGPKDGSRCSVFDKSSSRLDVPLFRLILNEQIDPMTSIVFHHGSLSIRDAIVEQFFVLDHAEMEDNQVPVERHEELPENEMPSFPREGRTISSTSQLSQSSTRTNETQSKPIRRDELILHA